MASTISTYKEWEKLTPDEKHRIVYDVWTPAEYKKGKSIRNAILEEFRQKYAKAGVISIKFGEYKYLFGIFVIVEKGITVRLPHRFDIFFVEKRKVAGGMPKKLDVYFVE